MNIFRWLIFLPLSILIAVVINLFLGLILIKVGIQNEIFLDGVSAFVFTFLFVFSAGIIVPSKRDKVAIILFGIIAFLAILNFILAVIGVATFAERKMPDILSIPVLQILGALYGIILVPCFTTKGITLEQIHRAIISLGMVVITFGGMLSIVGLIVGFILGNWVTLYVGIIVLGIGIITEVFPYIHLFFRFRKSDTYLSQQMTQLKVFNEMAQIVVSKVDEKFKELERFKQKWLLTVDSDDTFTFIQSQKIQSLREIAKTSEDIYSKWFIEEVDKINNSNDVYRIHLMSATIAYLAFFGGISVAIGIFWVKDV